MLPAAWRKKVLWLIHFTRSLITKTKKDATISSVTAEKLTCQISARPLILQDERFFGRLWDLNLKLIDEQSGGHHKEPNATIATSFQSNGGFWSEIRSA